MDNYKRNDELKYELENLTDDCERELQDYQAKYETTLKQAEMELQNKYH